MTSAERREALAIYGAEVRVRGTKQHEWELAFK
jgi:hypothetical protein